MTPPPILFTNVNQTLRRPSGEHLKGPLRSVNIDSPVESPWEKVLWRKQRFADNHVPPSFLSELNDLRT